jgi:hypothetical protein
VQLIQNQNRAHPHAAIEFEAQSDTEFVLGSAVPHDYDLIFGKAEARISEIQTRPIQQGRL